MSTAPKITPQPEFEFESMSSQSVEDLARVFNTALISTREQEMRDFSAELYTLMQGKAFKAILASIHQLAQEQGISEREAAESVVKAFRRVDKIWSDYIFHEGVDRLKTQPVQ